MNDHHFNVKVAIDYDPETAIFLNNMAFWLNITIANREHYYEGHYWIYNSYTQWSEIFPYFSAKQIRRIIDNAVANGLLMKGCFNQKKYDNTNWYTFTDKALQYYPQLQVQVLNTPAQTGKTPAQTGKTPAQTGRPIPYSNPVNNPVMCGDSANPSTHSENLSKKTKKELAEKAALEAPEIKELFNEKFGRCNVTLEDLFNECREHYEQKSLWATRDKFLKWIKNEKIENYSTSNPRIPKNETHKEKMKRYWEENQEWKNK